MGNKVINLGITNESPTKSLRTPNEVYIDVGMSSAKGKISNPQVYESEDKDILLQREQYEIGDKYRVAKDVNVRAVFNSLHNIFTWTPGERILDPEFGSRLRKMLYEQITEYNVEQIMAEIRGVVLKYEPRVQILRVVNVSDINDTENNTVRLDIIFTIPGLTSQEQYTYSYIQKRGE